MIFDTYCQDLLSDVCIPKVKGNLLLSLSVFVTIYGTESALVLFSPHSYLSHEWGANSLHRNYPEPVTGQQPTALWVLFMGGEGGSRLQHHFHRWTLPDQQTVWWARNLWWWETLSIYKWRVQTQKPLSEDWHLRKWLFLSDPDVYIKSYLIWMAKSTYVFPLKGNPWTCLTSFFRT